MSNLVTEKPRERSGRTEALAPRPARRARGLAGLAAVLAGDRRRLGRPPICGLISAIIAGLVLPFLGGSYVTISGPAAGLAPALLAAMLLLGRGDLDGRLSAPARRHLPDGAGADRAGQVQGGPVQRHLPLLGRRGDARLDRPADHRQATAAAGRAPVPVPTSSGASWPRRPSQFLRMEPKVFFARDRSAWR